MPTTYTLHLSENADSFTCRVQSDSKSDLTNSVYQTVDALTNQSERIIKTRLGLSWNATINLDTFVLNGTLTVLKGNPAYAGTYYKPNQPYTFTNNQKTLSYKEATGRLSPGAKLEDDAIPYIIKRALECTNRKEAQTILQAFETYVMNAESRVYHVGGVFDTGFIFTHSNFVDADTRRGLTGHKPVSCCDRSGTHSCSPEEMLEFAKAREAFFQENIQRGEAYQSSDICATESCSGWIKYYPTRVIRNAFCNFFCCTKPTRFHEEFNQGRENVQEPSAPAGYMQMKD